MKKIEVIVILLVLLLVSLIVAQEEVKLEQSAEEVDLFYEKGCEVLEEKGYNIFTFKKIDENTDIDCSFIKIEEKLYPNVKEGYLKFKGDEVVEAELISKDRIESATYGFLVNGDFKKINVGPNTKIVYKNGRLEVYGDINDFEVSEGNKVSLFNLESLEKPLVLEEDKVIGKFKFRDIKVDGVLKIYYDRYILEEGSAEFEDIRDVDGFVLNEGTIAKNKFGSIEASRLISFRYSDREDEPREDEILFYYAKNLYDDKNILNLRSYSSFTFNRAGMIIDIDEGKLKKSGIPNFRYVPERERGNLLLSLKNVDIYSDDDKGSVFLKRDKKDGKPVRVYLDKALAVEIDDWIPEPLKKSGLDLYSSKGISPETMTELNEILGQQKENIKLYARYKDNLKRTEAVIISEKQDRERIIAKIDVSRLAQAASAVVGGAKKLLSFGKAKSPIENRAKEVAEDIHKELRETSMNNRDIDNIGKLLEKSIIDNGGDFWIDVSDISGRTNIKIMSKDFLTELDRLELKESYIEEVKEIFLRSD